MTKRLEAITARRNCTRCSGADRFLAEIPAVAIAFLPMTCILSGRSHRGTVRQNTVTAAVREQEAAVGSSIAITRADDRPVVPVTA